uniref:Methylenetetrahydrofolate dehydrogenase (NADP+ dependent) 1 like n=1 Tax=Gorilla gorilla gorilla TaxID=9595 RepID=A0A2I2ZUN5_GORGO
MGTRLPLVLRQLRRPPQPPVPPRRLRVPCRASSGGGGGGREGLLGQRRPQDGQARSSCSPGGRTPAARDSIVREVIQNSKEVLSLLQEKNPAFKPVLAIIQAGDDNLMQEINQNLAEEAGLNITHICLPPDSSEAEIIDEILKINEDTRVHGLALQISENLFSNKVLNALKPEKDVDGVTDINLGKLVRGDAHECFVSPVAKAVIELLEKSGVNLDGKKILVVGAHGSLEAALQCLFQRKGSMTMSIQWKTRQLQSKTESRSVTRLECRRVI